MASGGGATADAGEPAVGASAVPVVLLANDIEEAVVKPVASHADHLAPTLDASRAACCCFSASDALGQTGTLQEPLLLSVADEAGLVEPRRRRAEVAASSGGRRLVQSWPCHLALAVGCSTALIVVGVGCLGGALHGRGKSTSGTANGSSGIAEVLADAPQGSWSWLNNAVWVFGILCIAGLIFTLLKWALIRLLIKTIETMDRSIIGADIEIGSIDLNMFVLELIVKDVVLFNPPGGYTCEHVFKAGRIEVDLNAWSIIKSFGKVIEVEEIIVHNISACMQFNGYIFGTSNVQAIMDHLKENKPSDAEELNEVEPVYDFWHSGNKEHTFHLSPAWGGETREDLQYFVYTKQVDGTEPVYDYWHYKHQEHTFHMGDPWEGERKNIVMFYAYPPSTFGGPRGTEAVYAFWHEGNQEHTFHTGEPWPMEQRGDVVFYALTKDPTGKAHIDKDPAPSLKPVHEFWDWRSTTKSFHFLPAWSGESDRGIAFYAYGKPVPGTQPVWDFWHAANGDKTSHFMPARPGEEQRSIAFHAFPEATSVTPSGGGSSGESIVPCKACSSCAKPSCKCCSCLPKLPAIPGITVAKKVSTEPVHMFWHEGNKDTTLHMDEPWEGEVKGPVAFHAFRHNHVRSRGPTICVRKVSVKNISASVGTYILGASVSIKDIFHEDFSSDYQATTVKDVTSALIQEFLSHLTLHL